MKNGSVLLDNIQYVTEDIYQLIKAYTISKDDLYITVAGTIGSVGEIPDELDNANLTENADKIVFSIIDKRFLMYALQSELVQYQIKECTTKVGQPKLAIMRIQGFLIALPPLNEQKQIVHAVEEVIPSISKYEQARLILEKLNTGLNEKIRKSILQEAIQGRLVPQDTSDEPVSILLQRIKEEKQRLVKEGKLKKKDVIDSTIFRGDDNKYFEKKGKETVCIDEEIPFEIPNTWAWVRLSDVIMLLSGRDLEPSQYNSDKKGIPYMTGASNFNDGCLIENRWTLFPQTISHKGDLLITCKGTIGTMAFNTIGDIHIARQIMAVSSPYINLKYLELYLKLSVSDLQRAAKSIIPGISRDDMLLGLCPLPPKEEQQRIVKYVEEVSAHL